MNVVCCQVEVFAKGRSPVQRNPNERSVANECDSEVPKGEAMTKKRVEGTQSPRCETVYFETSQKQWF
jgi:hypothetical protein